MRLYSNLPYVEKVNVTILLDFRSIETKNGKACKRKSNAIPFRLYIQLSCALRISIVVTHFCERTLQRQIPFYMNRMANNAQFTGIAKLTCVW